MWTPALGRLRIYNHMYKFIRSIEIANIVYFIIQVVLIFVGNKYPYYGIPNIILRLFLLGCVLEIIFFIFSIIFSFLEYKNKIKEYAIPLIVLNVIIGIVNFLCFLGLMPV